MLVYSLFVIAFTWVVISGAVSRPPNHINSGTDLIGMVGLMVFLGFIGATGILAIIVAYYVRGAFKIFFGSGALAILTAISYLPLSFVFNADVDLNPHVPDSQFLVGTWMDESYRLELHSDSSYILLTETYGLFNRDSLRYEGTWRLDGNLVHFSNPDPRWRNPWEVTASDRYYFITYSIPDNLDAWSGDLGLMREKEWTESH